MEAVAGVTQLRVWGLPSAAVASPERIAAQARGAGFVRIETELVGDRVIAPALRFVRGRLRSGELEAPLGMRVASHVMLAQLELLWRRGMVDYLLLRAAKPDGGATTDG